MEQKSLDPKGLSRKSGTEEAMVPFATHLLDETLPTMTSNMSLRSVGQSYDQLGLYMYAPYLH
jgi:hypothetical protein